MNEKEKVAKLRTRFYGIKTRCYNENFHGFDNYGGRGIKICDEWLNNIESFIEWSINNGFDDGLSIDRIDVNGNYEPSNCRWVDSKVQANNKREFVVKNPNRKPHSRAEEIALNTNKSIQSIYKLANKLNRLPTEEEVLAVKMGRPRKY